MCSCRRMGEILIGIALASGNLKQYILNIKHKTAKCLVS